MTGGRKLAAYFASDKSVDDVSRSAGGVDMGYFAS